MANFDDLPGEFIPNCPDAKWVPGNGPIPPKYFTVDSYHDMKDTVNTFYCYTGFACTINKVNQNKKSSKNESKQVTSFMVRCACGRDYKNKSTGQRLRSSSKMIGCEWKARCKKGWDKETAEYGWSFTIEVPHHNHNQAIGVGAFPQQRIQDAALKHRVQCLYEQQDTASKILCHLLATQSNLKLSDVKNKLQKLVQTDLAGRSMIEALLDLLKNFETTEGGGEDAKWWHKVKYDGEGHVSNLFFAHLDSFIMIKENPHVMQIDTTYKTNKFNMPLLHTVGVTSHHTIFDVCFGFMGGEDHTHYGWHIQAMHEFFEFLKVNPWCFVTDHNPALKSALTACYPSVHQRRCIWHINQNVQKQSMKAWDMRKAYSDEEKHKLEEKRTGFMERCHVLVGKPTQNMFWDEWKGILKDYAEYPVLIMYLEREQLPHYKEWAECFCRYLPDFGIRVTSRAEGQHHKVKIRLNFKGQSHLLHVV
jgi:hypothetical protein